MSAGWTAASVRGHGLLRRRVGPEIARSLAAAPSLAEAVAILAGSPYGRAVRPDMDLGAAQHAVAATALWHIRVLAGWSPPLGAGPLRLVASRFELDNIAGHLGELAGVPAPPPFELGSLATAWPAVGAARSAGEVRAALAASAWGDPGSDQPAQIRLALELAWARRLYDGAPGAAEWAVGAAALVVARVVAARASLPQNALEDARHLLGERWRRADSPAELASQLPTPAARLLRGVDTASLWRAEARWWAIVTTDSEALAARSRADASVVVGVGAALEADAWRVGAALAAAGHRGGAREVLDAVA